MRIDKQQEQQQILNNAFLLFGINYANISHLKLLQLQPNGSPAPSNRCFPMTNDDYELLKSLGLDRAIT